MGQTKKCSDTSLAFHKAEIEAEPLRIKRNEFKIEDI